MSQPHEQELSDLEKLLAAVPLRPAKIERDQLFFAAGRAAAQPSRLWPGTALLMSAATICLAAVVVLRPAPEPVIKIVQVQTPAPTSVPQPALETAPYAKVDFLAAPHGPFMSYRQMQQQALRFGVEGLPMPAFDGESAQRSHKGDQHELTAGSGPKLANPVSLYSIGEP